MRFETRVGDNRGRETEVFHEPLGVDRLAIPENEKFSTCGVDAGNVVAQLCDLLFAEESAELPDLCKKYRILAPIVSERNLAPVGKIDRNLCKRCRGTINHVRTIRAYSCRGRKAAYAT